MIYNGVDYGPISEKYSFKVMTGQDLSGASDMDNLVIYASSFYREQPDSVVLPPGLSNTTFIKCNLDNCVIPDGATLIDCTTIRFLAQPDGYDWIVDDQNQPVARL